MRLSLAALSGFIIVVLASASADAAPRAPSPHGSTGHDARALELFEGSATAYREGRFQDAVEKLVEARKLKPEPVLLYDLARAYEALGRSVEAADAYTEYLVEVPAAADRRAIEGRVAMLRAQAAALAEARREPAASEPPAGPPKPPPPDRSSGVKLVPWVLAGAGVTGVATGLVLAAVADGRQSAAADEPVQTLAADKQASAESLATAATITIVTGAIVAALGLSWLGARAATSSAVSRRPGAPLVLGGTFW